MDSLFLFLHIVKCVNGCGEHLMPTIKTSWLHSLRVTFTQRCTNVSANKMSARSVCWFSAHSEGERAKTKRMQRSSVSRKTGCSPTCYYLCWARKDINHVCSLWDAAITQGREHIYVNSVCFGSLGSEPGVSGRVVGRLP